MLYAIVGDEPPANLQKRLATRSVHLARLNELQDAGRLLLAGPFLAIDSPDPGPAGFAGGLIVAEFESLEAAKAWAAADPYVTEGVWSSFLVKPFRKTLPT